MDTGLKEAREIVDRATLSPEVRRQVLGRLDQLPPLYRGLEQTYESRFHEALIVAARGVVKSLVEADGASAESRRAAEGFVATLQEMHERLGLPHLGLKVPPPPPARKKAKAK